MNGILLMWATCWAPSGVQLASHVARRILKRQVSLVTKSWDDEARDTILQRMMFEIIESVQQDDLAHGDWCVNSKELNVWVDTSSLAIGVALEWCETVWEVACWQRPDADAQHIN